MQHRRTITHVWVYAGTNIPCEFNHIDGVSDLKMINTTDNEGELLSFIVGNNTVFLEKISQAVLDFRTYILRNSCWFVPGSLIPLNISIPIRQIANVTIDSRNGLISSGTIRTSDGYDMPIVLKRMEERVWVLLDDYREVAEPKSTSILDVILKNETPQITCLREDQRVYTLEYITQSTLQARINNAFSFFMVQPSQLNVAPLEESSTSSEPANKRARCEASSSRLFGLGSQAAYPVPQNISSSCTLPNRGKS
jgi:hypothetical protein